MEILGVDVSHYQNQVDVHASGLKFSIAKATEGGRFVDPCFAKNWQGVREAGLYRGAYHFGRPSQDPEAQAEHFRSVVGELSWGDLPSVLDLESSDGHPSATVRSEAPSD